MAYQIFLLALGLALAMAVGDPIQKTGATVGPNFVRQEGHKEDLDNRKDLWQNAETWLHVLQIWILNLVSNLGTFALTVDLF